MIDAVTQIHMVRHAGFGPGQFPTHWHDGAYALHCRVWDTSWEGRLGRDRFVAELNADHVDVLYEDNAGNENRPILAYIKWKATREFHLSRDELSDSLHPSLPSSPPAAFVCAYEITATPSQGWRGLGRRLLAETLNFWEQRFDHAVFCTYSPKRKLTTTLRRLADMEQDGRPALEAFAHRAAAAGSRHLDEWVDRLRQSLDEFIRREIIPVPEEQIMDHLAELGERHGQDVIDGVVAAIGIAYNFVLRASSGLPACGPAAFHRALGAEHWRQYPASATNCADALGLVDHWRYSHDPARRAKCAQLFKKQCAARAQPNATPDQLLVLS